MTYAQLINMVLSCGKAEAGINYCGEGDIYDINNDTIKNYPVFWVASTTSHTSYRDYMVYNLTLYYIDREQHSNTMQGVHNTLSIHSAGISILDNIIKRLDAQENVDVTSGNTFTLWTDTEIFSDKTNGVYTEIEVTVPKDSACIQ